MGYRHHIYEVDKGLVEKIRACKTNGEYIKVCAENFPEYSRDEDEDDDYFPIYDLGKELFDFGKYYENADKMYEHGDSLFSSEELREAYQDYNPIVLDKSGLRCAIEWQKERVRSIYSDLLNEKSALNKYDDRSQLERLQAHARGYLFWWGVNPCDLDESKERLASSWLYEHTIFDLVRIYKTFDWDSKCLVFLGW